MAHRSNRNTRRRRRCPAPQPMPPEPQAVQPRLVMKRFSDDKFASPDAADPAPAAALSLLFVDNFAKVGRAKFVKIPYDRYCDDHGRRDRADRPIRSQISRIAGVIFFPISAMSRPLARPRRHPAILPPISVSISSAPARQVGAREGHTPFIVIAYDPSAAAVAAAARAQPEHGVRTASFMGASMPPQLALGPEFATAASAAIWGADIGIRQRAEADVLG